MKIFLLLVVCFLPGYVYSQKLSTTNKRAITYYKEAKLQYINDQYIKAAQALGYAIKKDSDFIEAYLLLADIQQTTNNYKEQKFNLLKAIEIDSTFFLFTYFNLGVAEYNMFNYDEANRWFNIYHNKVSREAYKNKAEDWMKKVSFVKKAVANPILVTPRYLGDKVNGKYDEYWPSITADNNKLVYTVLIPKDTLLHTQKKLPKTAQYFHEDFYMSVRDEHGDWGKAQRMGSPINTPGNEGAQSVSADGNWMFFTACGRKGGKGSCDIFFSKRINGGWSVPKNIGSPVNTPMWESQPSFSADGRTLYFASNRAGGVGKHDIWSAKLIGLRSDGTPFFGSVKNLGKKINTPLDENSPFIHPDNETLYFSSEGWPGMGKMDLFLSRKDKNGEWIQPMNFGYPINSRNDEIGLVVSTKGDKAYFSSDRYNKNTGKDLYEFDVPVKLRPQPVSYVKGRVFDAITGDQLNANFELKDLNSGELKVQAASTDFSGEFLICLPLKGNYGLNVSKPGYLIYSENFDANKEATVDNPIVMNIYLKPLRVGESIVLNNIFYESNSFALKRESKVELDKVVSFLSENPHVKIQISGHTDNQGSASYNKILSEKRALAVYQYLMEHNIHQNKVVYKGYGMTEPIHSNETEEGRAKNRRTEMKILERF